MNKLVSLDINKDLISGDKSLSIVRAETKSGQYRPVELASSPTESISYNADLLFIEAYGVNGERLQVRLSKEMVASIAKVHGAR